jgi:hypothetical protein
VLLRTLSPPSEADSKDPFGAIFATRAASTATTSRAVSKRGKKNAQEALRVAANGLTDGVANYSGGGNASPDRRPARSDDEVLSDAGSERSVASSSSTYSASRGGALRSSGRSRGSRRFSQAWDANTSETQTTSAGPSNTQSSTKEITEADWNFLETVSSRAEEEDDARSTTSAANSDYSARSYMSLEGTSQLDHLLHEDLNLADAIAAMGFVKIRGDGAQPQDLRKRLKRRAGAVHSEPRAVVVQRDSPASLRSGLTNESVAAAEAQDLANAETLSQGSKASSRSKTSFVSATSTGTKPATEARAGLAERLKMSVTYLEKVATQKNGSDSRCNHARPRYCCGSHPRES